MMTVLRGCICSFPTLSPKVALWNSRTEEIMEIIMRKGEVLTVQGSEGPCRVNCLQGRLWITASEDDRDYFLCAGGKQSGTWSGAMVIEAWEDAVVAVQGGKSPERLPALHLQLQPVT